MRLFTLLYAFCILKSFCTVGWKSIWPSVPRPFSTNCYTLSSSALITGMQPFTGLLDAHWSSSEILHFWIEVVTNILTFQRWLKQGTHSNLKLIFPVFSFFLCLPRFFSVKVTDWRHTLNFTFARNDRHRLKYKIHYASKFIDITFPRVFPEFMSKFTLPVFFLHVVFFF